MNLSPSLPFSPADAPSVAREAVSRLSARGFEAELFLRGGEELSLLYDAATARGLEESGHLLRATWRVWRNGRCGVASGDLCGAEGLMGLAERAEGRAADGRAVPLPPRHEGLGLLSAIPEPSGERALHFARALVKALEGRDGCFQVVLIKQSATWSLVASTQGTLALDPHPVEQALLRYETMRGALVDGVAGPLGTPLEGTAVVSRLEAALDAVAGDGGAPEPSLPWVLCPSATGPLVAGLGWLLRGDVAAKGAGLMRAVGRKLFPSILTLTDEARADGLGARRVDDEGQPVAALPLIKEGKLLGLLHSTESAAALKSETPSVGQSALHPEYQGRGLRAQAQGEPEPSPLALTVAPGSSLLPPDRNQLDARLESFTPMARPARVTLRLAGWVFRGGERVRRIAPVEVELSLLDTFRKLQGVGADPALLPGLEGLSTPSLVFPALL